jgi:hypothetical protein
MLCRDGRAVVAGEPDQRVGVQLLLGERSHQPAESVVHLRDRAVMGRVGRIVVRIEPGVVRIGRDRLVRLVEADEQEEWLALVSFGAQPADRSSTTTWAE